MTERQRDELQERVEKAERERDEAIGALQVVRRQSDEQGEGNIELHESLRSATNELEALIGASTGREHDCDESCTWAHSEYAKLLMHDQMKAERELGRVQEQARRMEDKLFARIVELERERDEARLDVDATQA